MKLLFVFGTHAMRYALYLSDRWPMEAGTRRDVVEVNYGHLGKKIMVQGYALCLPAEV